MVRNEIRDSSYPYGAKDDYPTKSQTLNLPSGDLKGHPKVGGALSSISRTRIVLGLGKDKKIDWVDSGDRWRVRGAQRFNELAVDGYITPSSKVWSATDGSYHGGAATVSIGECK